MKNKTIGKWIAIAIIEVILSLILLAIAPIFLNSNKPMFGFIIWLSIPTVLGGSGVYVVWRLQDARGARKLFISRFPEYSHLEIGDFLDIPSHLVVENLEMLENAKNDPSLESLNLSLLDLLKSEKK